MCAILGGNLLPGGEAKTQNPPCMKYWEIIADNLSKAGFSLGWVSVLDIQGRAIWIVDAHGYGKRFIVRTDELLTAFLGLAAAVHADSQ